VWLEGQRTGLGGVEAGGGGFILGLECISRRIKFDSKQTKKLHTVRVQQGVRAQGGQSMKKV
jgi:hypothetical protein